MSEPNPSKYCAICKHYDVRGIYMTSCVRCIHWVKDKEDLFEVDVMKIKEAPTDKSEPTPISHTDGQTHEFPSR